MSYKKIISRQNVTVQSKAGDIIGPSNKKIKVAFDGVSIYGFGLAN